MEARLNSFQVLGDDYFIIIKLREIVIKINAMEL